MGSCFWKALCCYIRDKLLGYQPCCGIINYFNSIKFYQPSLDAVHDQFQDFNSEENLNEISNIFDLKKSFSFNNVSFFYNTNSFKILNQANLLLLKGECTIILGENGSGKSTFLNILSSLIKPSSGQVLVDEKINIHGGACALGHPVGASGARVIVTLLGALRKKDLKTGIACLCLGGGEATAIAVEIC
jgi:hypothetical protein